MIYLYIYLGIQLVYIAYRVWLVRYIAHTVLTNRINFLNMIKTVLMEETTSKYFRHIPSYLIDMQDINYALNKSRDYKLTPAADQTFNRNLKINIPKEPDNVHWDHDIRLFTSRDWFNLSMINGLCVSFMWPVGILFSDIAILKYYLFHVEVRKYLRGEMSLGDFCQKRFNGLAELENKIEDGIPVINTSYNKFKNSRFLLREKEMIEK